MAEASDEIRELVEALHEVGAVSYPSLSLSASQDRGWCFSRRV